MVIPTKQELRKAILESILKQKEDESSFKSRVIREKFLALPVFRKAKTILFYASIKGEVDTFAMIKEALALGKKVLLPVVKKEEERIVPVALTSLNGLTRGAYGIPEPAVSGATEEALNKIDLVVVPGVAFDRKNNRLGRGAGYYDRFLSELPATTPRIGLAFDVQIVDVLPGLESHDQPVTQVISN